MNETNTPGDAGVEIVKRIEAIFGDDWKKAPPFAGPKGFGITDDGAPCITVRDAWTFYLVGDTLGAQIRRDGRIFTGDWRSGEFEVVGSVPAPEGSVN